MGKMKELFMKQFEYGDLERDYLINDSLAKAWEEEEYQGLKEDLNQPLTTKIEISDGTTRIEVGQEKQPNNQQAEIFGDGF